MKGEERNERTGQERRGKERILLYGYSAGCMEIVKYMLIYGEVVHENARHHDVAILLAPESCLQVLKFASHLRSQEQGTVRK